MVLVKGGSKVAKCPQDSPKWRTIMGDGVFTLSVVGDSCLGWRVRKWPDRRDLAPRRRLVHDNRQPIPKFHTAFCS